jgi:hypothetical protein
MAREISQRLSALEMRRKGTDSFNDFGLEAQTEVLAKSFVTESYKKRSTQPHTQYALGAMQEVGADYTRVGLETAERVGKQLEQKLTTPVMFRLQGSVPLNIHIRALSDVDLLTLDNRFLTYSLAGCRSHTYGSTNLTSMQVLQELRQGAEKVLREAYPAAKVDCSGSKCIALSGGSLPRSIDVVPSHWNDGIGYQASQELHDRGVTILDSKIPQTLENLPFLHIKLVHDRDLGVFGGLKKAIRLAKSVRRDADSFAVAKKLSSFDIASLMFHADQNALKMSFFYELSVLSETQRFFDWCYNNKNIAKTLRTPDNTRFILDNEDKFTALTTISAELDNLAKEVAKEQAARLRHTDPTLMDARSVLNSVNIPEG